MLWVLISINKSKIMTKEQFISTLAIKSLVEKKDVEKVVKAFTETIKEQVFGNDETLNLQGFGTFKRITSAARMGRNPATGGSISIPATNRLKFKAGKM